MTRMLKISSGKNRSVCRSVGLKGIVGSDSLQAGPPFPLSLPKKQILDVSLRVQR